MQLGYKVSKCIITESRKKNRLYEKKNGFEVIFYRNILKALMSLLRLVRSY
jgi:hypothetical protein